MIRVFRNIRKKLLVKGDAKRYFQYAIGEVFLIVIGILIALSINNWNDKKNQREREVQIYSNIKNKIGDDRSTLQGVINYNTIYLEQYQYANQIIEESDRSRIDTLIPITLNLWKYSDFDRSSSIYQSLVNSGELQLLQNLEIIEGLQRLEEKYIYINRLEVIHFQAILQYVGPGIVDNVNFSTAKVESPEQLYSFKLQNLFISFINVCKEKEEVYLETLEQIDSISSLIDEELKK